MVKYEEIDINIKKALKKYHKQFQAILAYMANVKLGITPTSIDAIGKAEGGVTVNNREIVVSHNSVYDDWNKTMDEKPEERAVAESINEICSQIDPDNLVESLKKVQASIGLTNGIMMQFISNPYASNPLYSFFE